MYMAFLIANETTTMAVVMQRVPEYDEAEMQAKRKIHQGRGSVDVNRFLILRCSILQCVVVHSIINIKPRRYESM
jgi:hypothetical protein